MKKISLLREKIMHRFMPLLDSAKVKTPLEACIIINKQLKNIIKYKNTNIPFYPTIEETYYFGAGKCDGLCNLGTFIMRSVGIPTAIDCTIWSKMDLGHSWCSVLNNGIFYGFEPGETQPEEHIKEFSTVRHRIPAKVYRIEFEAKNIKYSKEKDDLYKTFLKSPLLIDVTENFYNKTINIQYPINKNISKTSSNIVYLCTHNCRQWIPLAVGTKAETNYIFYNVVGDNVFIIADCPNGKDLRYISPPFYVDTKNKIYEFIPDTTHYNSMIKKKLITTPNIAHILFYWDVIENRFIPLNQKKETDYELYYDHILNNALLWLMTPSKIYNQRIFFIERNEIKTY